jgi:hypothetical protein
MFLCVHVCACECVCASTCACTCVRLQSLHGIRGWGRDKRQESSAGGADNLGRGSGARGSSMEDAR